VALSFEIMATSGAARRGRLTTPHGVVDTPAFMPVGTLGGVKGVLPQELAAAGASIMLANLYHLVLRPGIAAVAALGGLHRFTGWPGPLATDSGGFQVWSLGHLRQVDDEGVTFRSHLDGARLRFTPASVAAWQLALGVDLAMVLDECPPWPLERAAAAASWGRTLAWARRACAAWHGEPGAPAPRFASAQPAGSIPSASPATGPGAHAGRGGLFGIAQGSTFRELREQAARELGELPFDGYAIGGVSVGEPPELRRAVVEWTAPALPAERPRYLMGVGYPADILHAVMHGVDLFDCVLPSRNARHGVLFTREGLLRIKNARFRDDPRPLDSACGCPACARLSRAFLHHLARAGELTAAVAATLHNLRFYLDFMEALRQAIELGALTELAAKFGIPGPYSESRL
jgi:queuine tRNA-ribosyltransferase